MEIYLDMGFAASLNVAKIQWLPNNPDLDITNIVAICGLVYLIAWPIWLIVFYPCNHSRWHTEEFQDKFGSTLDGTNFEAKPKDKWLPLIFPVMFIFRRVCFFSSVIAHPEFLWLQLAL